MKKYSLSLLFSLCLITDGFSQILTNGDTEFWVAFPRNVNLTATIELFITSTVSTSGTISSAYPGVNQSFTVTPGTETVVILPSGVALQDSVENKGIHIVSNDPISVIGHNSLSYSADSYLALPVNALGTDYWIASYVMDTPGAGSSFSVVATQDGTTLTIHNKYTNSTYNVSLNMGQTYLAEDSIGVPDLTGSRVQSNYPVAVFGSNPYVKIGPNCTSPEYIVEQMFPHSAWGKTFPYDYSAGRDAPPTRAWDDVRVLAAEDGTDIYLNGNLMSTINAGQCYSYGSGGPLWFTTSKPSLFIQCAQGHGCVPVSKGDPFMMLVTPAEQYLKEYTIYSIPGFTEHWVNIMVDSTGLGTIYQDGVLIPTMMFIPCSPPLYYGAQVSVTEGQHTFTSTHPFGVSAYGWGTNVTSYGYPGGGAFAPIVTIDTILLTPPLAYGQLNVTNLCFMAHVLDNSSNPVPGALVTFHISGISNMTGTAYTDASGYAQYCYSRTGSTTGTDSIHAECSGHFSTTSLAIWSLTPPCINPTDGGIIAKNQVGCGSFTPDSLTSTMHPIGQTGTLEYKWQRSTTSAFAGFNDIPGTNAAGYAPGTITQTTWYRRLARVDCMADWSGAVASNVLEMTIVTPVIPTITIVADHLQVCEGDTVHFTANPANGGTNPLYQWKVNGSNAGTSTLTYSYAPNTGDVVTCTLTSSDTCTTGNPVTSNPITLTVNPILQVSVSISASANPFCQGSSVTFTATPTNGGTNPFFQWKVNGINFGTNSSVLTFIPSNGDCISCVLTSSYACVTGNPATSGTICMTADPNYPVSISINASANPVCAGTQVTFTSATMYGGTTPFYQWKVNGVNTGPNSPVFIYTPLNGDCITCTLTSNLACATNNPATSNLICMTVNPNMPVSISISASANPVCTGTSVTFLASPTNPGLLPVYQWKVNGLNVGTNNSSYTYTPVNGDHVLCILTSDETCATNNPATSNQVNMTVNPNLVVNVSIAASANPVCAGIPVTFTATPVNGGVSPSYQWKVNGITAGTNNPIYTYTPVNGDIVSCVLTSGLPCTTNNPATSNSITMNIGALPVVTFTRCNDSITTTNAKPFKLKGGIPLGGTYSGAGVAGGIFHPAIAGVGNHQITYSYTNAALCSANAIVTIVTVVTAVTTCGNPITDIRDNKVYQTVQIGSQCWFAEDLNYGTEIPSTQYQRDNCTAEKYHNPASSIQHPASVYQWDEIVNYDETISDQGLCPPAWHVPSEADWNVLFTNYINNGFAASPLKYSGFSGFNALLSGAGHMNKTWDWPGFATFFWSSTSHGTTKALAHGMNDLDPSVSVYPALRSNAFSVRCIKDN